MSRAVDVEEFARRVDKLCDFLLNAMRDEGELSGSSDIKVIQDLKDDAIDLSLNHASPVTKKLTGLSDFMKGA